MCPLTTPWDNPPPPAQGTVLAVAWPRLLTPGTNGQWGEAGPELCTPSPAPAPAAQPAQHHGQQDASESTKPTNVAPTQPSAFNNKITGHLSHGNRNALAANRSSWCTTHACAGTRDVPSSHLTAASALCPGLGGDALSCSQGLLHAKPQSYTENKLIYRDSLAC